MWGVPEEETLSWGRGKKEGGRLSPCPQHWLAPPSPPHLLLCYDPQPPARPRPLCKEGEGPATSVPGDPRRAEKEQKRTQTHTHTLPLIPAFKHRGSRKPSPREKSSRVWPSKSSKLRGETGWEETSTVLDPRLHGVGARWSARSASDTEPGRELKGCRKKCDGACQGQSPGSVRVCCCCCCC